MRCQQSQKVWWLKLKTSDILDTIKAHMQRKGVTQIELAKRLTLTQANVSATLSGKRDVRVSTLIAYCECLDLEINIFEKS